MRRLVSIFALATAAFVTSPAFAEGAVVSVSYGEKAELKLTKTYGARERETLQEMIQRSVKRSLGERAARVEVTLVDVTANRPTFKELGDKPGLSMQSFGIGGADLTGKAFDASGNLLGEVQYDWYGDILLADTAWTWSDADRTIEVFARKLSQAVPG
jgi:hypothetical protein